MLGIALALLSALSLGSSQIFVRKNLEKSNFIYISLTVTIMGNIILWPIAITFTDLSTLNSIGVFFFIIAGLLAPGITRLFYFKGMETAGISTNASIFSTYPIYTSIIAVMFLGETLTSENWIGLLCVVMGAIFIGRTIHNGNTQTEDRSKKGLILPLVGSLSIAFSQTLRKEGLNIYNQPLLGVAIGYLTSLFVYLVVIAFSKKTKKSRFSRKDINLFWKPGVGIAIGWLLSFLALSQEMVSIVVPILQTELLFILILAYIFLRKFEKISFSLVASSCMIIIGVVLISIN